jgi:hypothetical protein
VKASAKTDADRLVLGSTMSRILLTLGAIAGVAALDAAFIPAVVIVVAGLWVFAALDQRGPLPD